MNTHKASSNDVITKPLRQCVLRCDSYLSQLDGGTYGYTRINADGTQKFHGGVDLYAPPGTETYAIYQGVVEWVMDFKNKGWGKCMLVRLALPGRACWTLYGHLSETYVKQGTPVEAGTLLGLTGISGNGDARYPHLHFEAWHSKKAGTAGTRERYRFDPLELLGFVPFQPFALDVMNRQRQA